MKTMKLLNHIFFLFIYTVYLVMHILHGVINRPGVARAVLQTAL